MIIINPQWQGIGRKNPVPQGAAFIQTILKQFSPVSIPLDDRDIALEDQVKGLTQISDLVKYTDSVIRQHSPSIIFTCGGDCSSDFAQLAYLNQKYNGDFSLLWIDAHADLNTPESSPSKNFHGMTLRALTGEGAAPLMPYIKLPIHPSQLSFFGLRSIDPEEIRYLDEHSIRVFKTDEVRAMNGAFPQLPHKNVYIHVDIDSLDETILSECVTPTSGGFKVDELIKLIQHYTQNYNVIGGCFTEYGPKSPGAAESIVEEILFNGFDIEKNYAEKISGLKQA